MKNFILFDVVAITADLPKENLGAGQVDAIVEVYQDGEAFEVEFVDRSGRICGLLTLPAEQPMLLHCEPAKIAA